MFPIKHVVIITKENHTFDNYFGAFPGAAGVALPHAKDPHPDQGHGHDTWLKDKGAAGATGTAKTQYNATDILAYWAFAQQYTLCDNYFTDVASQSEPNHLFLIAANSPLIDNSGIHVSYQPHPPYDMPSLPAALEAAGKTWRCYADPETSFLGNIAALADSPNIVAESSFKADLAAGTLPSVSWLYPPEGMSDHPGDWAGPVLPPGLQWSTDRITALGA